jgi:hypothetical protein
MKRDAEKAFDELADFVDADENGVLMPRRHLFDEERYLAANPDVAAAMVRGDIASARGHWLAHGKSEGRAFTETPWASPSSFARANFDERRYLAENPDVAAAITAHKIAGAREHFERYGRVEGRRFPARAVVTPVTEWAARRDLYGVLPAQPAKGSAEDD